MINNDRQSRSCPSCGGEMRRGEQPETVSYQGRTLSYLQPGWHCADCGDGVLEGADNEVHDAALHEVMAQARRSPISPLLIRAAREAVGLSQREAGQVFGGGPTAFYKYESGKAVPSEGMANLLRLALERPKLFRKRNHKGDAFQLLARDAKLLRKIGCSERLNALIRHVYPAGSESAREVE